MQENQAILICMPPKSLQVLFETSVDKSELVCQEKKRSNIQTYLHETHFLESFDYRDSDAKIENR